MRHEWRQPQRAFPSEISPSEEREWAADATGTWLDGELLGFPEVGREMVRLAEREHLALTRLTEAQQRAARLEQRLGEERSARPLYGELIRERDAAQKRADYLAGEVAVLQGRLEQATAELDMEAGPGVLRFALLSNLLAEIQAHHEDHEGALDTLRRIISERDDASARFRLLADLLQVEVLAGRLAPGVTVDVLRRLIQDRKAWECAAWFNARERDQARADHRRAIEKCQETDGARLILLADLRRLNERYKSAAKLLALLDSEEPPQGMIKALGLRVVDRGIPEVRALADAWRWLREQVKGEKL